MSDFVVACNCCMTTRMLPGEAELVSEMNRSAREGNKCKAL